MRDRERSILTDRHNVQKKNPFGGNLSQSSWVNLEMVVAALSREVGFTGGGLGDLVVEVEVSVVFKHGLVEKEETVVFRHVGQNKK